MSLMLCHRQKPMPKSLENRNTLTNDLNKSPVVEQVQSSRPMYQWPGSHTFQPAIAALQLSPGKEWEWGIVGFGKGVPLNARPPYLNQTPGRRVR